MKQTKENSTYTVNSLAIATGFDRATILRRLKGITPDSGKRYTLRQVLEAFENYGAGTAGKLDLAQERAQLAREQRLKLERDRHQAEGTITGSVRLEVAHNFARDFADLLMVTAKQFLYGIAPQLTAETEPQTVCDHAEQAMRMSVGLAFAASRDGIPPAMQRGFVEGVAGASTWDEEQVDAWLDFLAPDKPLRKRGE